MIPSGRGCSQVLEVWTSFINSYKQRNQPVNFGRCSTQLHLSSHLLFFFFPLAVCWSNHHPVHTLAKDHYYQYVYDAYTAVCLSIEKEVLLYMKEYLAMHPKPKIGPVP